MPNTPGDLLVQMALRQFRELTEAEKRMFRAAADADEAYCGSSTDDDDASNDASKGADWGDERSIGSAKIRWLCVNSAARALVDPQGIRVHGARLTELNLYGVDIPFPLVLEHCHIEHTITLADTRVPLLILNASFARTVDAARMRAGSIYASKFRCEGTFKIPAAVLTGNLGLDDCIVLNGAVAGQKDSGLAVFADDIHVGGHIFLQDSYFDGCVRFAGAGIGGDLTCNKTTFRNTPAAGVENSGTALKAYLMEVRGMAYFDSAVVVGEADLSRSQISGALYARFQEIDQLDLRDTQLGVFVDGGEATWPQPGKLFLDGFVYGRFEGPAPTAPTRLPWLRRDGYFSPQPYQQLAKVLKANGDEDGAHQVLIEMERRRRREKEGANLIQNAWSGMVEKTTGYGYAPARAVPWLLGLSALGWIIYRRSYLAGELTPADKDAYAEFKKTGLPPAHHPGFVPLVYSVENAFPLVKLGQGDRWRPDTHAGPDPLDAEKPFVSFGKISAWPGPLAYLERALVALGLRPNTDRARPTGRLASALTSPGFVSWFRYVQIVIGWLLATLVVAGVASLLRKE